MRTRAWLLVAASCVGTGCHFAPPASETPEHWRAILARAVPGTTTRAEFLDLLPRAAGGNETVVPRGGHYLWVYDLSVHFAVSADFLYDPGEVVRSPEPEPGPDDLLLDEPRLIQTGSY